MEYLRIFFLFLGIHLGTAKTEVRDDCECGKPNIAMSARIVNGYATTPNKYPWMAALYMSDGSFLCGGAIISSRHILTAAHCIFYIPDVMNNFAVLGMHNMEKKDGDKYNYESVELHPNFINYTQYDDFDVAVITLDREIQFNDNVRQICIPSKIKDYSGKKVVIAGWGKLSEVESAGFGTVLQESRVTVKKNDECAQEVNGMANFNTESMMCAMGVNTDACQGDSGGPLFLDTSPKRYEVFGVVSFGEGCNRSPGVYARINNAWPWFNKLFSKDNAYICRDPEDD